MTSLPSFRRLKFNRFLLLLPLPLLPLALLSSNSALGAVNWDWLLVLPLPLLLLASKLLLPLLLLPVEENWLNCPGKVTDEAVLLLLLLLEDEKFLLKFLPTANC